MLSALGLLHFTLYEFVPCEIIPSLPHTTGTPDKEKGVRLQGKPLFLSSAQAAKINELRKCCTTNLTTIEAARATVQAIPSALKNSFQATDDIRLIFPYPA